MIAKICTLAASTGLYAGFFPPNAKDISIEKPGLLMFAVVALMIMPVLAGALISFSFHKLGKWAGLTYFIMAQTILIVLIEHQPAATVFAEATIFTVTSYQYASFTAHERPAIAFLGIVTTYSLFNAITLAMKLASA